MVRRLVFVGVIVTTCLTMLSAYASSLTISSKNLASGASAVTACGSTSAWTVSFTQSGTGNVNVASATVSSIQQSCSGRTLVITVSDSNGAALGAGQTTINSTNCGTGANFVCILPLTPTAPATTIAATAVKNYAFYETQP